MTNEELIKRGIAATVRNAEEAAERRSPRPSSTEGGDDIPGRRLVVTKGSEVKLRPLVWWEPGLILRAAINLVGGREGKGKSTIVANWVAQETRNGGTVIWLGSEEPRDQAIAPRLVAAEADMDRVIFIDVEIDKSTGSLVFPLDLPGIEKIVVQHQVTMIVLDPCKGLMPAGISGNDDVAIRQYLEPIATMVARHDLVLLGIAHFGKRQGDDSGKLLLGSIAWSQVARSVLSVAEDPDTGHRIVTNTKANYTGTDRSIEYRFVSRTVPTEDGPTEIGAAEFIGDTTKDARDYLSGAHDDDNHDIDRWLTDFLKTGSKKANEVYSAADAAGYSKDQAKRAKKRLGIKAERPEFEGPWFWSLPAPADQGSAAKGAPPAHAQPLPSLPCTSEGVRRPENGPREQSMHDRSLDGQPHRHLAAVQSPIPVGGLTPHSPGQTDRVARALAKATDKPICSVCSKPVVAGQGDTHFSCTEGETA